VKVRIGRHFSGAFPIHIGLKDVSCHYFSTLLSNMALRKVQVKKESTVVKLDHSHIQGRTGRGYREWGDEEDVWAERS